MEPLPSFQPSGQSLYSHSCSCWWAQKNEKKRIYSKLTSKRKVNKNVSVRTLYSIYLRIFFFRALLARSRWVGKWHLRQQLPCRTNRLAFPFYSLHISIPERVSGNTNRWYWSYLKDSLSSATANQNSLLQSQLWLLIQPCDRKQPMPSFVVTWP